MLIMICGAAYTIIEEIIKHVYAFYVSVFSVLDYEVE